MAQTSAGRILVFCFIFLVPVGLLFCTVAAAGTETLISTNINGLNHQLPTIYSDRIVWTDVDPSNKFSIIHMYNITSGAETLVTDNTSFVKNPTISDNFISYTDCGGKPSCPASSIHLYDISTGANTRISSGTDKDDFSAISGNRIVWRDNPGILGGSQIYINDTPPGTGIPLDASLVNEQAYPAIYGDLVAYTDCDGDVFCTTDNTIYVYDISQGTETQLSPGGGRLDSHPAVYGNRVAWQGADATGDPTHIFINSTSPAAPEDLSADDPAVNHYTPETAGDWVVWYEDMATAGYYYIFANDTVTHEKISIAAGRHNIGRISVSFSPADSVYRVVWDEQDASGYNIHLYTSGPTQTCPVAGFSNDFAGGAALATVHFTDTSSASPGNPVTHWSWDFGDGTSSTLKNPTHTYNTNGPYDVTLTVSTPLCRNTTTVTNSVVVGQPVARFSASATTTVVNAPVTLTDSSIGSPTEWDWYWGDGAWTNGTAQNPQHAYAAAGMYSVTLVASNGYGSSTITKSNYITVKPGANADENTNIAGIVTAVSGSRQFLVFNYTTLPSYTLSPDLSTLTFTPPGSSGFASVIITTTDAGGFVTHASNTTITGNVSTVHLQTADIHPTGFSATTGGQYCSLNYSFNLSAYPVNAGLNTQVWESSAGSDSTNFNTIASGSGFSGTNGTAYTTKITKTNFPAGATATLRMSLNATWVASKPYGRNEVYIERIDDSGTYGQVLSTRYVGHNATANLDYFEADSPNGLSTFGLSFLEGSGNLFQMVTLTVSSVIAGGSSNQGFSSESGAGTVSGAQPAAVPQAVASPLATPDTGKTAKLYFNANDVITQATTLQSNDRYATLTIGKGTVVTSAGGAPPASVSLRALQAADIPASAGSGTFAGMAYDLGPAGAGFSPTITLTFTNPNAGWGSVYTIRTYNAATQSWEILPTAYDPATNAITAQVSHFCVFALFAEPVAAPSPKAAAPAAAPPKAAAIPAPPAPTAMSTFAGLIAWIAESTYGHLYLAAIAIVAVVIAVFMRRRRQDPLL